MAKPYWDRALDRQLAGVFVGAIVQTGYGDLARVLSIDGGKATVALVDEDDPELQPLGEVQTSALTYLYPMPTPQQLRDSCAEIQRGWTAAEERNRNQTVHAPADTAEMPSGWANPVARYLA